MPLNPEAKLVSNFLDLKTIEQKQTHDAILIDKR